MFVEAVQGNGGINVPPPEYFLRLKRLLEKYGALLIVDEVQTGLGRTGRAYAIEHWHVEPDIVTGGKALGGATPIGYFSTSDRIAEAYTRPGASTFGGNPVTAVAGLTVLKILRRDGLIERSATIGEWLMGRLKAIACEHPGRIAAIRGLGLMIGVELRAQAGTTAAEATDAILEKMKDAGFLLGKTGPGRDVLTWMPPLIITETQLQQALDAFVLILRTSA